MNGGAFLISSNDQLLFVFSVPEAKCINNVSLLQARKKSIDDYGGPAQKLLYVVAKMCMFNVT